jgi:hypothetical protein
MKTTVLRVATLALFAAITSAAEAQTSKVSYGGSIGLTQPLGKLGDVSRSGFHLQGHAQYEPSSLPFSWRADVGYWTLGQKTVGSVQLGNARTIITLTGNAVYNFDTAKDATFVPYVIGGAGFYSGNQNFGTNFGINAGGGVTMKLAGFETFGEARLHNVFGDGSSVRLLPLSFGVRIKR